MIYRDLEALDAAGFPLYTEVRNGKNHWMVMDEAKIQSPLPLNFTELMALYFCRDMVKVLKDTVFHESLETLFKKIRAILPEGSVNYLEQIEQSLHVGQRPYKEYSKFREIISTIQEALTDKKCIEIVYFTMSRKKKSRRKVAPYSIWIFDGTLYLIGFCHQRKEIRMFALDRIKMLLQTDESFEIQDGFDAREFMQASFGVFQGKITLVRIWFDADIAGYIREKTWHDSQIIQEKDDGSIILEVEVAGTDEIKFWIMQWGAKAIVLEPESLKNEIMTEAEAMLAQYNSDFKQKGESQTA